MAQYIHFTDEQKQRAAEVDLEEFLRQRGEKLLPSGRDKRLDRDHMLTPNCLIGARPFTFTSGIGPMHPDPAGRALRQSPLILAYHAAL